MTTDDCYFYPTVDMKNGLFILPKTYYVFLLDETADAYRVEYLTDGANSQKLVGFCRKEKVSPVDYRPANPYLYKTFNLVYETEGENGDGFLTQITLSCTYYGDYPVGDATYCYVLRGEEFGYVKKPADFSYEKNTEFDERNPSITTPTQEENTPPYALYILLVLLVPVAAFFILKFAAKKPFEHPDER